MRDFYICDECVKDCHDRYEKVIECSDWRRYDYKYESLAPTYYIPLHPKIFKVGKKSGSFEKEKP